MPPKRRPVAKDAVIVRTERPIDHDAVYEVVKTAFGQPDEAHLVEELRKSKGFIPELSLVAVLEKDVIGHVLFFPIFVETPNKKIPVLSLAPVSVKPGHQKKGVGSKLVREGLKMCRELGHKTVVVIGHPEYYPRFGFVPARPKGLKAPFDVPDAAFMVIELRKNTLKGVLGVVRYPPEFNGV